MDKKDSPSFLALVVVACSLVLISTLGVNTGDKSNPLIEFGDEVIVVDSEEISTGFVAPNYMAVTEVELPDEEVEELNNTYIEETRFDVKPSLWQRIKNSKLPLRSRSKLMCY